VRRKDSGRSFNRSFSDPLGSAASRQGKGKHRRHPTDPLGPFLRLGGVAPAAPPPRPPSNSVGATSGCRA